MTTLYFNSLLDSLAFARQDEKQSWENFILAPVICGICLTSAGDIVPGEGGPFI
jgi:hypothetical protein